MSLKRLKQFGSASIPLPDGSDKITVRGINGDDVAAIVRDNSTDIQTLIFTVQNSEIDPQNFDYAVIAAQALHLTPRLVAHAIARATDDGDDEEAIAIARRFPLELQAMLLEQIGSLTFAMTGSPKNFIRIVMRAVSGLKALNEDVKALTSGTNQSDPK